MKFRLLTISALAVMGVSTAAFAQSCPSDAVCVDVTANSGTDLASKLTTPYAGPLPSGITRVLVRVPAGTYTESSYIDLGSSNAHSAVTEVTCDTITSGWGSPPDCIVDFNNDTDGFYINGASLAYMDGFWIKGTYHPYDGIALGVLPGANPTYNTLPDCIGSNSPCDSSRYYHALWAKGSGAAINLGPKMQVSNYYYGISASEGGYVDATGDRVYLGGDANFYAYDGGIIYADGAVSGYAADLHYTVVDPSHGLGHGFVAESLTDAVYQANSGDLSTLLSLAADRITYGTNSYIHAQNSYSYGAVRAGYIANLGGVMDISGSYPTYNYYNSSAWGVGVWAAYGSIITANSVQSGANLRGFYLEQYSTITAQDAVVGRDAHVGAWVRSYSYGDFTNLIAYGDAYGSEDYGSYCDTGRSATVTGATYTNILVLNNNC